MKKVALVVPYYDKKQYRVGESLGVKYLASYLINHGVEAKVFEGNLIGKQNLHNSLYEEKFDLIGFSINIDELFNNALPIIKKIKTIYQSHITLGGYFSNFNHKLLLEKFTEVDSVIRGEGEEILLELIMSLPSLNELNFIDGLSFRDAQGNIQINQTKNKYIDINLLPNPIRDKNSFHLGNNHFFVSSSRGCTFCCSFCSIRSFYNNMNGSKWRARSPKNVIHEIQELDAAYKVETISFIDPNFLGSSSKGIDRGISIGKLIYERFNGKILWSIDARCSDINYKLFSLLREYGLRHVFVGVESFYQPTLNDLFKKKVNLSDVVESIKILNRLNIDVDYGFIMFHPYTTIEELLANVNCLKQTKICNSNMLKSKLTLYEGSNILNKAKKENVAIKENLSYRYDFINSKIEIIYNATSKAMKSLKNIETKFAKKMFEYQHANNETTNIVNLKKLKKEYSDHLVVIFEKLVTTAENLQNTISSAEIIEIESVMQSNSSALYNRFINALK